MVRTCNAADICDEIPCVRRCCQRNEKYARINNKTVCTPDNSNTDINLLDIGTFTLPPTSFNLITFDQKFQKAVFGLIPKAHGTLYGQNCKMYKLDPNNLLDRHLINTADGSIYLPNEDERNIISNSDYCFEHLDHPTGLMLRTFLCFPEPDEIKFQVYSIGIMISCVFFLITLIVYLFVPKLRNLPGKILICLVTCLLIAYTGVVVGQKSPPSDDKICYSFAFFIYFSMTAAFSWMNIMCFDIWLTFGSTCRPRGNFDQKEWGRFLIYSLYGWGMPTLLTAMTIGLTRLNLVSDDYQPKFGEGKCWFQNAHSRPHLVFFLGPVGILFLFNFVLFVLTLKYCNRVKKDIQRMQSTNTDKPVIKTHFSIDKARFIMNTKLFIVMGITWFLEIISTLFHNHMNEFWWYATDLANILQGVLVFFVFVFKRRVWYAVLDRFGIKRENKRKSTTMATTSSYTGSGVNLHRLRSNGSCSSLLAINACTVNGKRLSSELLDDKH